MLNGCLLRSNLACVDCRLLVLAADVLRKLHELKVDLIYQGEERISALRTKKRRKDALRERESEREGAGGQKGGERKRARK